MGRFWIKSTNWLNETEGKPKPSKNPRPCEQPEKSRTGQSKRNSPQQGRAGLAQRWESTHIPVTGKRANSPLLQPNKTTIMSSCASHCVSYLKILLNLGGLGGRRGGSVVWVLYYYSFFFLTPQNWDLCSHGTAENWAEGVSGVWEQPVGNKNIFPANELHMQRTVIMTLSHRCSF